MALRARFLERIRSQRTGKTATPGAEHLPAAEVHAWGADRIVTSGSDNIVRLWDRHEGRELAELNQASNPFRLAISPDAQWLAAGDSDNTVVVWNLSTRGVHRRLPYSGDLAVITFGRNGQLLTATRDDPAIHIWDPVTGQELSRIPLSLQPSPFTPKWGCSTSPPAPRSITR